jgi:hypothetical protein
VKKELIVCRVNLSVVLPHFEVFCKGFFIPPNGGIILGSHFGLSTFGVHLNGMLGDEIRRQGSCDRVSNHRSGVSGTF